MAELAETLAIALERHRAGQLPAAEQIYRQILVEEPNHPDALHLLGVIAQQTGRHELAITYIQQAIAVNGSVAAFHNNLATACKDAGRLEEAIASYRQAVAVEPQYAEAHNNLGVALGSQGKLSEAIASHRRSLTLMPGYAEAYNNLGVALSVQGDIDEAIACFRRAVGLKPDFSEAHSNLLWTLQCSPGITLAALKRAHARFERQHAAPLRVEWRPHVNSRDGSRRLRVGFVSADFAEHPVGFLLIRALENLDPEQIELVCYSTRRAASDAMTHRFEAAAAIWRSAAALSDAQLARQVRADSIDILVDLAGHTAGNRLLAFARKPAPVQLTWAGYVGSTGLAAIDYLVADPHYVPASAETEYSERIARLPDAYVCYDPPSNAPECGPLPAERAGRITFGSFNNPAKINLQVVTAWAAILSAVPGAQLVLQYRGLDDPGTSSRYRQAFAELGIDSDRVELRGWLPHADTLLAYRQIDVALDPFPYNGGLTTCEALWMGVPVVTHAGETFAHRHGLSYLANLGLAELITYDADQYVAVAASLAGDLERLARMRASLRQRLAASALCDGKTFAANLTALLRSLWQQWVG